MPDAQRVTVLGSTGSIGCNTLDVIATHPQRFNVFALTANSQITLLLEQCVTHHPQYAVVMGEGDLEPLQEKLKENGLQTQVLLGLNGLKEVANAEETDIVVAAIVGAAGLEPTMAAVEAGKRVLLANKESLVMSGRLFTEAVHRSGAVLLPVDSEHNAIFQCLPNGHSTLEQSGVRKIYLTGSGGPFRETPLDALPHVTPEQAVTHPNWSMGKKISVDSSTMMNKGLEYIEACWLFNASPKDIDVIIHPQSIIHSMVEYLDGSIVAQMGRPDMRTPIAHCLGWPDRIESNVESLDLCALSGLDFYKPDFQRFPCLKMAIDAMEAGGSYPVALNAANEVLVESFLNRQIRYPDIAKVLDALMNDWAGGEPESLCAVKEADTEARAKAQSLIGDLSTQTSNF